MVTELEKSRIRAALMRDARESKEAAGEVKRAGKVALWKKAITTLEAPEGSGSAGAQTSTNESRVSIWRKAIRGEGA